MTTDDFETLSKSFTFVFWFCMSALQTAWSRAWDALVAHPTFQVWALRALWAYSSAAVQFEKWYNVWFPTSGKKPEDPPRWTSVCTLDTNLEFSEVLNHNPTSPQVVVANHAEELYDYVILAKEDADLPWISVRRTTSSMHPPIVLEKSAAHFLAITYHHPDLGEAIPLDVPVDMMVVDNEILSPAFVRRALTKASSSPTIPFDDRYWIECIDHRITLTKLMPRQYLLLTSDGGHRVEDLKQNKKQT